MHVRLPLAFARCRSFSFAFCPYPGHLSRAQSSPAHLKAMLRHGGNYWNSRSRPQPLIQEPEYMLDEGSRDRRGGQKQPDRRRPSPANLPLKSPPAGPAATKTADRQHCSICGLLTPPAEVIRKRLPNKDRESDTTRNTTCRSSWTPRCRATFAFQRGDPKPV